jgi:hypothetical protein
MANKMIREEMLHDEFLKEMVRSEEPLRAPEGFLDGVMERIRLLPSESKTKSRPYTPPLWLKWGVPSVIMASLMVLLIWGPRNQQALLAAGPSIFDESLNKVNSWLHGFNPQIRLPQVDISGTVLWILIGGMVLSVGFWFLSRFLEKNVRR